MSERFISTYPTVDKPIESEPEPFWATGRRDMLVLRSLRALALWCDLSC